MKAIRIPHKYTKLQLSEDNLRSLQFDVNRSIQKPITFHIRRKNLQILDSLLSALITNKVEYISDDS